MIRRWDGPLQLSVLFTDGWPYFLQYVRSNSKLEAAIQKKIPGPIVTHMCRHKFRIHNFILYHWLHSVCALSNFSGIVISSIWEGILLSGYTAPMWQLQHAVDSLLTYWEATATNTCGCGLHYQLWTHWSHCHDHYFGNVCRMFRNKILAYW